MKIKEVNITQPSFSTGIVSTELFSRIDFSKLSSGLKQCENFIVRPAGGVAYRTGLEIVSKRYENGEGQTAPYGRLIPFVQDRENSFCLAFGDGFFNIFKSSRVLLDASKFDLRIASPYKMKDLKNIRFAQNNNKLYLVCKGYRPNILTYKKTNPYEDSPKDWTFKYMEFNPQVEDVLNLNIRPLTAKKPDTVVNFNWQYAVSVVDENGVEGFALKSNEVSSDVDIHNQNIEVKFSVPTSQGSEYWRCFTLLIDGYIFVYYKKNDETPILAGDTYWQTSSQGFALSADEITNSYLSLGYQSNAQRVPEKDLNIPEPAKKNFKGFNIYRVYQGEFYFVTFVPFKADKPEYTYVDTGIQLDTTKSPKKKFTAFDKDNYPQAICFHNQRLIFGNTPNNPGAIYGSRVGKFDDFTTTPLNNVDESFELSLSSNTSNYIMHMVSLDDLIVFTQSKIWRITGTDASNMNAFIESYSGASDLAPQVSKKSILFVENSGNVVSNFIYSYEINGYFGQNLDLLCRELFEGHSIVSCSMKDSPFPIFYAVRNDGVLLTLTYLKEENIYAWSIQKTDGKFLDVCCVDSYLYDDVYVLVKRGEFITAELFSRYIKAEEGIENSYHLDSYSSYHRIDKLPKNSRLAGKDIVIRADKDVFYKKNYDGEEINLGKTYYSVIVGLPYKGVVEPIPVDLKFSSGSSTLGIPRRINNVTLRYYKTRGLWWGTDEKNLYEIKPYTGLNFADEIELETSTENLQVRDSFNKQSSFVVVQKSPYPALIQSITMEIDYGQKD